jgi:hypothetical protein
VLSGRLSESLVKLPGVLASGCGSQFRTRLADVLLLGLLMNLGTGLSRIGVIVGE